MHTNGLSAVAERSAVADLRFRRPGAPLVSVVIAVHNHLQATIACLQELLVNTMTVVFEVIVADDASSDDTAAVLRRIEGVKLICLETNLGFLGAMSAAVEAASGTYLLMLNNDTEVRCGWLDALLDVAESDVSVGAVASKLLFPDGRLQEAGSIVWSDGSAWNWGYGADPDNPAFNFRRDIDYASAASLLVRRSAFDAVGGFDRRFMPAYYEDADLCFQLRAAGHRVVYQPESVVMHHGSLSHPEPGAVAAASGGHSKLSMKFNRHIFSAKWASVLDRHWPSGTAGGFRGGMVDHRPHVLVCDAQVPAHDTDAGGLRMTSILELLAELGCHVTLLPFNGLHSEPYVKRFQRLGVEVFYSPWSIEDLARERPGLYDLVILSRPDVGDAYLTRVRSAFPGAHLIYDTVDLHHLRELRRLELLGEAPGPELERLRRLELRLMRSVDHVAAVTDDEARVIAASMPEARTVVLPTVHTIPEQAVAPLGGRSGLIFIGGFHHPPNVDAVVWFVRDVLPMIHQRWQGHLTILGSHPTAEVMALASDTVTITGYLPDVGDFFHSAAVFVAPMRYGAGIKGKVGHAMSLGLPVVTTRIGAEGMGILDGTHALVSDDAGDFADAVVRVATDAKTWDQLSRGGLRLIQDTLSRERMRERLRDLLSATTGYTAPCI